MKGQSLGLIETWGFVPAVVAADAASKAAMVSLQGFELARGGLVTVKLTGDSEGMSNMVARVTIGPTLDPHNVSDAIDVLSQRNGFHISDIAISGIPYRRVAE